MDQGITWVFVSSTAVQALCFQRTGAVELRNGNRRVTGKLYVCFRDGAVYEYHPVMQTAYTTLLNAVSIGEAMWHIVPHGLGKKVGAL